MPALDSTTQLNIEAVMVLAAALVAVIVINLIPSAADLFELLITMIHELGHVLTTIFTGGEVKHFIVYPPGQGGVTEFNKWGSKPVVTPAGYLAAPLFSAILILLSGWPLAARYTLIILGGLLILGVLNYGQRSSRLTMLTGLGFGLGLIWVGWQADLIWVVFLLYFLALQMAWMALNDLFILARLISLKKPVTDDDASKMAQFVGCAPGCWVISWLALSLLMLGGAFWFTWLRPLSG